MNLAKILCDDWFMDVLNLDHAEGEGDVLEVELNVIV
jgi:hypothetical protein